MSPEKVTELREQADRAEIQLAAVIGAADDVRQQAIEEAQRRFDIASGQAWERASQLATLEGWQQYIDTVEPLAETRDEQIDAAQKIHWQTVEEAREAHRQAEARLYVAGRLAQAA